jgi:DNA-binding NarL/FixJ family response regulator
MIKDGTSVLIVAKPGRLRDGLHALLTTVPQLKIVGQADGGIAALEMISAYRPALLLLDFSLSSEEIQMVLAGIRADGLPQPRSIVLVDTDQQYRVARGTGADAILIKGFVAPHLFAIIERLEPDLKIDL